MSLTQKLIEWIDKLHVQNFFIQEDDKVYIKIGAIDLKKLEDWLDKTLDIEGQFYETSELEEEIMSELNYGQD
jgi:hypothetical protein